MLLAGACWCTAASAQVSLTLVELINAYRAAPGSCDGRQAAPVAALSAHPALSNVRVATGAFLDQVLARNGYPVAQAEAISVTGPKDARAAMDAIEQHYCKTLLNAQFSVIGAGRSGNSWLVILARPALSSPADTLPELGDAGQAILDAVNAARANGRTCGDQAFAPAPALSWNAALAQAALAHSVDMATKHYMKHEDKQGRTVSERAIKAGYAWRSIGENIAAGQESTEDVVAGWLASPGHCANIMRAGFTDLGAAYAISHQLASPRVYWTQVFGTPR